MTDKGPEKDVPHARFDLSIEDLPVVVPGFVGPFRVVLLALSEAQDKWELHYAAIGDTKGGVRIEAEDDTGNSYDVRGGTESRGDADPIVGRWDLIPPADVRPGLLRLTLFFDKWSQPESWDESVEDKRERARRWIDILEAQLAAAEHRHLLADLMYASDERTTAIARVTDAVALSEFQAHFVADFSLGRMTEQSRRQLREQLSGFQTELRELGD